MGLSTLAANLSGYYLKAGKSFTALLGVSRQYIPLYREFNVDVHEHRIIAGSTTWVSPESFVKLRALNPKPDDVEDAAEILEDVSFERFVNYFTKQKAILKTKLKHLMILYKDYINMSKALKVDLSRKSVRFPKNIKTAHNCILASFNKVKHEIEDENFKQAAEKLYAGLKAYAKGEFCIVLPQLRGDLVAEGQSLNHCVGGESYYQNHIKGTRMIFFVRKAKEPDKSFFTMEIDMGTLNIRQLYGFGGCSPSADVRQFANEFLRRLQPNV